MSSVVLSKVEKKNFYLYPENPTFKKFLTKEAKEVYTSIMGYSFFFFRTLYCSSIIHMKIRKGLRRQKNSTNENSLYCVYILTHVITKICCCQYFVYDNRRLFVLLNSSETDVRWENNIGVRLPKLQWNYNTIFQSCKTHIQSNFWCQYPVSFFKMVGAILQDLLL